MNNPAQCPNCGEEGEHQHGVEGEHHYACLNLSCRVNTFISARPPEGGSDG